MSNKKLILIILIILFSSKVFSQEFGQIKIVTNPKSAIIRLDTILLKSGEVKSVPAGDFTLKMWAPKRRYYESKVKIASDSNISMIKTLTFEDDFITYQQDLKRYKMKRFASRYFPIPIFIGLSFFNFNRIGNLNDKLDERYNRVVAAKENYNNAYLIEGINSSRDNFNSEKAAYDKDLSSLNQAKVIAYGTIGVEAVVSWYLIRYSNKLKKPTYEPKSLLSNLELNYKKSNNLNSFVLTYNF